MSLITLYTGRIGYTISLVLSEDNGTPINLTSATVVLNMYTIGSNTLALSKTCIIDDAANGLAHYTTASGDFNTTGQYYTLIQITYTGGNARTEVGPEFEIISGNQNIVTVDEFLSFINIPSENAMPVATCRTYLEEAETLVNLEMSSLATSTDTNYIKLKRTLIKLKAAILYFMNMDEQFIDPNKRLTKIEAWTQEWNRALERLNNIMGAGVAGDASTVGSGVIRRIKDSSYNDPDSYLYES
jgi:hypothetical protein